MFILNISTQCARRHNFDLSSSGYVNLLTGKGNNSYDKTMLESRTKVIRAGLFGSLIRHVRAVIDAMPGPLSVLDAGCGEGSVLKLILNKNENGDAAIKAVGLDISKAAIQLASRHRNELIWCVGDIARLPFGSRQFKLILNILSPANYSEFSRVLREDGQLIKVIPGPQHLQEIRELLFPDRELSAYDPVQVLSHAKNHLTDCTEQRLLTKNPLPGELFPHAVRMTPLSWRLSMPERQPAGGMDLKGITTDFYVLTGRLRNKGDGKAANTR